MRTKHLLLVAVIAALLIGTAAGCRDRSSIFTIALDGKFSTLDPIGSTLVDANSERLRSIMYNTLVKKDDKFDYVGDLAESIEPSEDGLSYTFTLRKDVKFHNGAALTSKDVKYTMDKLFESEGAKAAAFTKLDPETKEKEEVITGIETPDAQTVVIKIAKAEYKNILFPNLVPVAIIPDGSKVGKGSGADTTPPPGTGAYKFSSYDTAQQIVELEAYEDYWEGAANIKKIRVKILADASALQAEILSGTVDMAPAATNLTPDTLNSMAKNEKLKVEKFPGSNIQYLWFNTEADPVNKKELRQAIAYAIDREKILKDVLNDQATLASSILPEASWAYDKGTEYKHDPEKAKKLLDDAGFKDEDGDGTREMKEIIFKLSSGSKMTQQYATVMQTQLKAVGIPVKLESMEFQTMLKQVSQGQFMMTTGRWVGGNQDPIFLKDLFGSDSIPKDGKPGFNRGRFSNEDIDKLLNQAVAELDREKAKALYVEAQQKISEELPLVPLWYAANMVVASEKVENIEINASGDWDFVRKLTLKE